MSKEMLKQWLANELANDALSVSQEENQEVTEEETTASIEPAVSDQDAAQEPEVEVAAEPTVFAEVVEMVEAKAEQDRVEQELTELVEAQEALEAYVSLLEQGLENGGIGSEAAAFLRVGIERFEQKYGLEDPLTPGLEAFGGTASRMHSTEIALESFKEVLKKGWEAVKKMLLALWRILQDVYTSATAAASRLEKRADQLRDVASKNRTAELKEGQDKVVINNPAKLMANGVYVGDNVPVITGLVTYTTQVFPEKVRRYVDEVAYLVSTLDPTNDQSINDTLNKLYEVESVFDGFPGEDITGKDPRFERNIPVKRTAVFANNMALYISYPKAPNIGEQHIDNAMRFGSKLRVELLEVIDAVKPPAKLELPVADMGKLGLIANQVAESAGLVGEFKKDAGKLKKALEELVKAGDGLKDRASKGELSEPQRIYVNCLLRDLVGVQKLLGTSINGVLAYAVTTLTAQLALVERQMEAYELKK